MNETSPSHLAGISPVDSGALSILSRVGAHHFEEFFRGRDPRSEIIDRETATKVHDRQGSGLARNFCHKPQCDMRILATSVFERIVYHCSLVNGERPSHPTLVVDALLRDGDADGPLLVAVADFKRMIGVAVTNAAMPQFRNVGRTEIHDGVEYIAFAMWERFGDAQ